MAPDGLRVVRLRPFNHTGPGQGEQFVVPAFARQLARIAAGLQEPVLRVGNLDSFRDFLDVRDVCAAYVACIVHRAALAPGTIINIASGVPRRVGDVLDQLIALTGLRVDISSEPGLVRPTEIRTARGDPARARALLGWEPAIPWDQTLADIIARSHSPAHQT
jgi:GDP-4-dehydro-6-deoxy-D-mannose reductase